MRSGVCGAVCRPACGAGKDPEDKQPPLCESPSWFYVRVSSAVGSSDAEGERRGCSLRNGGGGVGAAERDGGPELRGAMAAAPRPAPCCVRRGARPDRRLGPSFWPAALWRASWPSCGAGTRAGARGPRSAPQGHAGLIRVATRPGALGAEARRVARGPSAEGRGGGNSWNGAV